MTAGRHAAAGRGIDAAARHPERGIAFGQKNANQRGGKGRADREAVEIAAGLAARSRSGARRPPPRSFLRLISLGRMG
jgi:hypothetical protein